MGSKMIVRPPRIAAGSRVALVAPAGPLLEHDDLRRAQELCRALGWEPVLGRSAVMHEAWFAGPDDSRLADLNWALTDPAIHAVWCIRGGYGVTRILDRVDFEGSKRQPRPVLGYSDITALLLALYRHAGCVTFHAPVARRQLRPFSRAHLERVVASAAAPGLLGLPDSPEGVLVPEQGRVATLAGGRAEGPLVGGNLSLVQCLLGTEYLPSLDGALLFLEDVGEDAYRVDRMFSHLRLAGLLERLAGVIIGRFTEMPARGADGAAGLDRVLAHYLEPLRIPVAFGFPIGHLDDQWTLPIGVRARLDADAGTVELLEPAVS